MFIQYDPETGQIMAHVCIPEEDQASIDRHVERSGPLVRHDEECSTDTHYVCGDKVVERPSMILAVVDTSIYGIPKGSILLIGSQSFVVEDWTAEISGYSGTVKITCWPYLDEEVEV